jgi:hypothetical protein
LTAGIGGSRGTSSLHNDMTLRPLLVLLVTQHCICTAALAADEGLRMRRYAYPGRVVSEEYRWVGECNVRWPKLPFRGSYRWLARDERDWLLEWYESIPEGDAPPYPKDGIGEIIDHVGRSAAFFGNTFTGEATVFVEVDSTGSAVSTTAKQDSDASVARMITDAVRFLAFDAGSCSGKPCKMMLPVQLGVACQGGQEKRTRGTTYINVTP